MTTKKAKLVGEALRMAMQVFFVNESNVADRDKVKVSFHGAAKTTRTRSFLYHVAGVPFVGFNTVAMTKEIVKIVPNVSVTAAYCYFFSRSITLIAKELGKTGTYNFDFVQVTA